MDIIPHQEIENHILTIRTKEVMIDLDIATLYGVETKRINEAVKNNPDKFPSDFMFELEDEEFDYLRSKFSSTKFAKTRTNPKAFTEQGVYMLATILKSKKATETSISIMRTFARIRQHASNYMDLFQKIEKLESNHDRKFDLVAMELQKIYDILDDITNEPMKDSKKMGFIKK